MLRHTPGSTRTYTRFPYSTLFCSMAAGGIGLLAGNEVMLAFDGAPHLRRQALILLRRPGRLRQRDALVGADHGKAALGERDVGLGRLQQVPGDFAGALDDPLRRAIQRLAAQDRKSVV